MEVDGADGRVSGVDRDPSAEVIGEEADLAVQLSPDLEGGDFRAIALDVLRDHHEIFLLRVLEDLYRFPSLFGDLEVEGGLGLDHPPIGEDDYCVDRVGDTDVHSDIGLEEPMLSAFQLEPKGQLDLVGPA